MKLVDWEDEHGWKHRSLLRDDDPSRLAHEGLPQDPPSVHNIDWNAVQKALHNQLFDRGLFTRADLYRNSQDVQGAVLAALKRAVIELYN